MGMIVVVISLVAVVPSLFHCGSQEMTCTIQEITAPSVPLKHGEAEPEYTKYWTISYNTANSGTMVDLKSKWVVNRWMGETPKVGKTICYRTSSMPSDSCQWFWL